MNPLHVAMMHYLQSGNGIGGIMGSFGMPIQNYWKNFSGGVPWGNSQMTNGGGQGPLQDWSRGQPGGQGQPSGPVLASSRPDTQTDNGWNGYHPGVFTGERLGSAIHNAPVQDSSPNSNSSYAGANPSPASPYSVASGNLAQTPITHTAQPQTTPFSALSGFWNQNNG